MFIVSNRIVHPATTTVKAFGDTPNQHGSDALRVAEALRVGGQWQVKVLPDFIDNAMAAEVGLPATNGATGAEPGAIPASRYVSRRIVQRLATTKAGSSGRNVLLYVHGYNNDLKSVLDRAAVLETSYGVEVVPFSWPANGGGIRGLADYKSDKRDALKSTSAFDRVIARVHDYINEIHQQRRAEIEAEAHSKFAHDAEKWDRFFTKSMAKLCPFTVNLMLHSMGNYIYKHVMDSTVMRGGLTVFDNIVMVAADTNNEGHVEWVDRIQCRGRVYITLNENDAALAASRLKMGEQQKARLGHYPHRLDSRRALYIDFTRAKQVGDSHAYFEGTAIKNASVRTFFQQALNGEIAETALPFDVARNVYGV